MEIETLRRNRISFIEKDLANPQYHNLEESRKDVASGLAGKAINKSRRCRNGVTPVQFIRGGCWGLGQYLIESGQIKLWKEDLSGWAEYWLGCRFTVLSEAIELLELQKLDKSNRHDTDFPTGVRYVASLVLMGDYELAVQLLTRILPITWTHRFIRYQLDHLSVSGHELGDPVGERLPNFYDAVGLEPMLFQLFERRFHINLSLPGPPQFAPLGPYSPIIEAWDDPVTVGRTLKWMCDDRILSRKVSRQWMICYPAIWREFPVDVMTVYKVRSDLGLETSIFSHPELVTPFCELPKDVPRLSDPQLDQAAAWARERYPELADAIF
jgi:hypothetical protein